MKDLGRLADGVDALVKQLQLSQDQISSTLRDLATLAPAVRVRENSHLFFQHDTGNVVERRFSMLDGFGIPANSLTIVTVGGGSLEVSVNGGRFVAVNAGDVFEDENIKEFSARVTTAVAGTALFRAGAYVPPAQGLRLSGERPGVGWPREVV